MALLPVADALAMLLDGARPKSAESVGLHEASGRVLSQDVVARRTQPPFDTSAMDGYAVRAADVAKVPVVLSLAGVAAAGAGYRGELRAGQAVRIFTGAPLPTGADAIVIQENTRTPDPSAIEILEPSPPAKHIRRRGLDFAEGDTLLEAGRVLDPAALSLAAAGNHPALPVWRKPVVAIIATGDELRMPGDTPGPDEIIASNTYGVAAICAANGAEILDLGIAPDRAEAISALARQALDREAEVIVTLGGASVGDHDLAQDALAGLGMSLGFWKIAMRPGKPLMFGRLGAARCLGLPGNPVSSLICSHLFLKPMVRALAGLPHADGEADAVLGADMGENDNRQDYVRATLAFVDGNRVATPFPVQDSSMLRTLAQANAAIIRAPHAASARAGDPCRVLMLR